MAMHLPTRGSLALAGILATLFVLRSSNHAVGDERDAVTLDHVMYIGGFGTVSVLLDTRQGDIWGYDLQNGRVEPVGKLTELGKPIAMSSRTAGSTKERAYVAAMKSDLRNLVTAQEAYFADSGKYANRLEVLRYSLTSGNRLVTLRLTADGWVAQIASANTRTVCSIYVGATALAPATREGEPACQ